MATLTDAPQEVLDLLTSEKAERRKDLVEAGVTIAVYMARAKVDEKTGEPRGPALKEHGYPVAALIKVNSYDDRVQGKADATIKLDDLWWEEHTGEKERRALLYQRLLCLLLDLDQDGQVKLDDAMRPRLKTRKYDATVGIFRESAEVYGEDSQDVQMVQAAGKVLAQLNIPFKW